MRSILGVLMVILVCGEASAATVVAGPYLRDVGPDRVIIAFETDAPTAAAIEVGETDAYGTTVASPSTDTWHEVALTDLPAKSLRHYRVVLDGAPAGRAGTFITAPATPEPFSFLVYGDNRSDPDAHALVVDGMLQYPASLVVNTGDLVSNGSHPEQWTQFFGIVADLIGDMPILANVGNHDLDGDGPPDTFNRSFGPTGPGATPQAYRAFDHAGVRFLMLDRFSAITADLECILRVVSFEQCMDAAQTAWLLDQLDDARTNPAVRHVIVSVHEGPYSSKPGRNGAAEMRQYLNRFAASKVRMILSGHDHYYEHGIAGNGIHYVITGGGGAPLYVTDPRTGPDVPPHEVIMSTSVYHYLHVTVDGDAIEVTAWQADGTQMERFQVTPPPPCATVGDCAEATAGTCPGAWECGPEQRCLWACTPPPECSDAGECEIRTPEEDCSGEWGCLEGKCVWACDPPPELVPDNSGPSSDVPGDVPAASDVQATPDNPPPLDPGLEPDAAVLPDNPPPLDPGLEPDAAVLPDTPPAPDPGPTSDATDTPPAKKSGGCSAVPLASGPTALLPLLLMLPLAVRRRR